MEKLPDKKTGGDTAREVGQAIVSAIPVAGGPLQVLNQSNFRSRPAKANSRSLAIEAKRYRVP